jgi:predicted N-formylglutamate amidohydrolase
MTREQTFNMNAKQKHFLQDGDPAPYSISVGNNNVLFTGPHNGHAVPQCLPPCMDTDPQWFAKAHEAVDLHVAALFDVLKNEMKDSSFLSGNYSRLVFDLNAKPDFAIRPCSCENDKRIIPANTPENCTLDDRQRRMKEIYTPYHDAKNQLINDIRNQHNNEILVLDLHSFTPVWQGEKRNVEIGTIRSEKTDLSDTLESFLREQDDFKFISGEPYRVANRPSNAAPDISEKNKLQYLGLEIRYDLIDTHEKRVNMAQFIHSATDYVLNHPNRSNTLKPQMSHTEQITWSI